MAEWRGGGDHLRGLTYSFAHQRLVVLYAKLGRVEDARREWHIFSATFTTPARVAAGRCKVHGCKTKGGGYNFSKPITVSAVPAQ